MHEQRGADPNATQPVGQQFLTFLHNTFTGQLGISVQYRIPVSRLIMDRMGPTLLLVGSSTIFAILIGVYLGIRGAWERGGMFDRISTSASLTLYAMPEWWLGLLLVAALGVGFWGLPGIFPTGGLHTPGVDPHSVHGYTPVPPAVAAPVPLTGAESVPTDDAAAVACSLENPESCEACQ
jgi:peptide/nickel transport system permease protein